ncbi:hypothetical protein BDY19DRAFT_902103 [Irpex rosettiformis]|uniref:Uncharacterized protein n=1 Tax=Irpex rosettiformis TaxID=378272 RepID=A0ACB8UL15_9APHY|nr:hypothetical protein BDY19DRAFT_902103 [Irpex rosettiformis]
MSKRVNLHSQTALISTKTRDVTCCDSKFVKHTLRASGRLHEHGRIFPQDTFNERRTFDVRDHVYLGLYSRLRMWVISNQCYETIRNAHATNLRYAEKVQNISGTHYRMYGKKRRSSTQQLSGDFAVEETSLTNPRYIGLLFGGWMDIVACKFVDDSELYDSISTRNGPCSTGGVSCSIQCGVMLPSFSQLPLGMRHASTRTKLVLLARLPSMSACIAIGRRPGWRSGGKEGNNERHNLKGIWSEEATQCGGNNIEGTSCQEYGGGHRITHTAPSMEFSESPICHNLRSTTFSLRFEMRQAAAGVLTRDFKLSNHRHPSPRGERVSISSSTGRVLDDRIKTRLYTSKIFTTVAT